jgi:hypothetical protein
MSMLSYTVISEGIITTYGNRKMHGSHMRDREHVIND